MGMVYGSWLFVLGVLGAANLIISRKPDAQILIRKITPYQGWIGAVSCLGGLWIIVSATLSLGLLRYAPIYWITYLLVGVLQAGLGFLLGIGVLKTFIKKPEAQAKMDQLVAKLAPFQGILGLAAIGLSLWFIISRFVFTLA